MGSIVIYHSLSGTTRRVAERITRQINGDKIEITPEKKHSGSLALLKGCYRSIKRVADPVVPGEIDVSDYEMVIICSPVWAGKPTPVINGAIKVMTGCQGKKVFAIMTCRNKNSGNKALAFFVEQLKEKGFVISKTAVLDKKDAFNNVLIAEITEGFSDA